MSSVILNYTCYSAAPKQAESGSEAKSQGTLYYLHLNKNHSDSLLNVKGLLPLHTQIRILPAELSLQGNNKHLYRTEENHQYSQLTSYHLENVIPAAFLTKFWATEFTSLKSSHNTWQILIAKPVT